MKNVLIVALALMLPKFALAQGANGNRVTTFSPIATTSTTSTVTVGTSSSVIVAAGVATKGWTFADTMTTGSYRIFICYAATCTAATAVTFAYPSQTRSQIDVGNMLPPGGTAISAIAEAAGQTANMTVFQ